MHAHRPDFCLAADDGDESEAKSVRTSVLGQLEPMLPAMSKRAVIDEYARAAGADHGGAGLHHRPRRWQRAARTAQENVHGVAIDRRQFVFRGRLPTRAAKDLGKLIISRHGPKF